ncbi:MAG: cyclase family protein, partial [Candidatus Aminicenantaceae bacterium]
MNTKPGAKKIGIFLFVGLIVIFCSQCQRGRENLLDMTYVYDENTIYWPTAKGFELKKIAWEVGEAGYWYASNEYSASEHGGTHADAPIHFAENGRTMDQ